MARSGQTPRPASARRLREAALVALLALVTPIVVAGRAATAGDEEWEARIARTLTEVEMVVAVFDGQPPIPGKLRERITRLNDRLAALEKAAGLAIGKVSGKDDLYVASSDAAALKTRSERVRVARTPRTGSRNDPPSGGPVPAGPLIPAGVPAPPADPAKPADPPKAGDKPPAKPAGKAWPATLDFSAGARVTYQETGSWIRVETEPNQFEDRFMMDGYSAHLSFSLRSKGLLSDVKSATIRVAVRMKGPLTDKPDLWRVYEVTWVAEKVFNNESSKHYMNHDEFTVSGPYRWVTPHKSQATLEARAHVLSVTLPDGSTRTFEAPTYKTD